MKTSVKSSDREDMEFQGELPALHLASSIRVKFRTDSTVYNKNDHESNRKCASPKKLKEILHRIYDQHRNLTD